MTQIKKIEGNLSPLLLEVANHKLFTQIDSIPKLRFFMQQHIFAVWDFICLLKELHSGLVSTTTPWFPPKDALSAHLISEIVMEEECDLSFDGTHYLSHFEMYVHAMKCVGAETSPIEQFLYSLSNGATIDKTLEESLILPSTKNFVRSTFCFFSGSLHELAAAFVFGREAITPAMFLPLVKSLKSKQSNDVNADLTPFIFYLERHIQLDGDEHFPKALRMLDNLIGNDSKKGGSVEAAARKALLARINFLSGIQQAMPKNKKKNHATTTPRHSVTPQHKNTIAASSVH